MRIIFLSLALILVAQSSFAFSRAELKKIMMDGCLQKSNAPAAKAKIYCECATDKAVKLPNLNMDNQKTKAKLQQIASECAAKAYK